MHSISANGSSSQQTSSTCLGGRLTFLLILIATNVIPALSSSSFPSPSSSSLSSLKSTNITPKIVIESNCDTLPQIWGLRDNNQIITKNTVGNMNVDRRSPSPFLPLFSSLSYIKRHRMSQSSSSIGVIESLRGGGVDGSLVDDDEEEYDDEDESESEDDVEDESCEDGEGESDYVNTDDDSDESDDVDEIGEESSEGDDESEDGGYDEESEYDEDEEEIPRAMAPSISSRSDSGEEQVYDEQLVLSSTQEMGVTLGVLLVSNKLDMTNTRIIRVARFAYIAYVILAQLFLVYVRLQAHKINDRTALTIDNPLSNMLKNQLGSTGGGDMVKSMANSFLSSVSTVMEYDLSQAKNMNSGLLLPMLMLYFLHFRMGQVQPLIYQTVMGIKTVMTSPLFQVYVLGRNLERPFRNPQAGNLEENQDVEQDEKEVEEDTEESDDSVSETDSDYSDSDSNEDSEYDDESDDEE